jgi:hypothetical protein
MNRRNAEVAGVGAILFGVLSFAGLIITNWPGRGYNESDARRFVDPANLTSPLISTLLGLVAVVGLVCLFAYFRQLAEDSSFSSLIPQIVWGIGLAAAATFAVGWGLVSAQPLAHAEAGVDLGVSPKLTYMISEATSAIIFGPAPMLVGLALVVFALASGRALPGWLRWATLVVGVIAVASLAFFPWFVLLLWSVVIGVWLLITARRSSSARGHEASPESPT